MISSLLVASGNPPSVGSGRPVQPMTCGLPCAHRSHRVVSREHCAVHPSVPPSANPNEAQVWCEAAMLARPSHCSDTVGMNWSPVVHVSIVPLPQSAAPQGGAEGGAGTQRLPTSGSPASRGTASEDASSIVASVAGAPTPAASAPAPASAAPTTPAPE